jgi:outer membrane protein
MNKIVGACLAAALVILTVLLTGFGSSKKTGFVDLNKIVSDSDAGKEASAKLQGLIETKEAEVQEKRNKLLRLQDSLKKNMESQPKENLQSIKEQIALESREFDQLVNQARQEIQNKNKALSDSLLPEIKKIVRGIGHQKGYIMIMDINTGEIIYHEPDTDITVSALQQFNEKFNINALGPNETSQQ